MAAQPPAGMYIDPDDPRRQRFWNGSAWTDHVMPVNGAEPAAPQAMYAELPTNAAPPIGPPTMAAPPPPPGWMPPPSVPPVQTPYGTGYYPAAPAQASMPMHMRPLSQAAVWSIVLSFMCPLVGLAFAFVALNATGPTGDRRGRSAAIVGLVLCIVSAVGGFFIALAMGSSGAT